jgi:hypothetical protein
MMILRLVSVWIAVVAAVMLALVCHLLASELGAFHRSLPADLPLISRVFFPDAIAVYLFPLPLVIWAAFHTVRSRAKADPALLIITTSLGLSLVFSAVYAYAMVLPFIPGYIKVLPE